MKTLHEISVNPIGPVEHVMFYPLPLQYLWRKRPYMFTNQLFALWISICSMGSLINFFESVTSNFHQFFSESFKQENCNLFISIVQISFWRQINVITEYQSWFLQSYMWYLFRVCCGHGDCKAEEIVKFLDPEILEVKTSLSLRSVVTVRWYVVGGMWSVGHTPWSKVRGARSEVPCLMSNAWGPRFVVCGLCTKFFIQIVKSVLFFCQ